MATKKPEFEPRRAEEADQVFDYNSAGGELIRIKADKDGIVRPKSEDEKRAADAFDLPVARKVAAAEKSEAKADAKAEAATTNDSADDAGKEG